MFTHCTLKIPLSLTRPQLSTTQVNTPATPSMNLALSHVPELHLPQAHSVPGTPGGQIEEEYKVIRTCFSMTIRRDRYDIPVAIMGQWIVSIAAWKLGFLANELSPSRNDRAQLVAKNVVANPTVKKYSSTLVQAILMRCATALNSSTAQYL